MPIVESNQPLSERPPIILIFGEQATWKTSIVHTCENPMLMDFDRGSRRSKGRKTVLEPDNWQEVLNMERSGQFKKYNTIGIDTPKAALDDFLVPHAIAMDSRMGTQKFKLQLFGAIGDAFKQFINNRRFEQSTIFMIAHAKKDEDSKKIIPDITGQSLQLILRIADQIGYIFIKNGKRMITFEPSEGVIGKNTAQLPEMEVPEYDQPGFKTFGAELVAKVKTALAAMSDEQREALEESEKYQTQIENCTEVEDLSLILNNVNALPPYLQFPLITLLGNKYVEYIKDCNSPEEMDYMLTLVNELTDNLKAALRTVIQNQAKVKGWKANIQTKKFELINAAAPVAEVTKATQGARDAANEKTERRDNKNKGTAQSTLNLAT